MNRFLNAVAGLAVLASLQSYRPLLMPAPSLTQQASEAQSSDSSASDGDSTPAFSSEYASWSALCHYFLVKPKPPKPTFDKCIPGGYAGQVELLIATVPDPVNGHLALEYDRNLESIERAAFIAGYTFDRYWVPWIAARQQASALEAFKTGFKQRRDFEQEPGILIFHPTPLNSNHDSSPEHRPLRAKPSGEGALIVFLVAETPASGVNAIALHNALKHTRALQDKLLHTSPEIKIAGPTFSGSLYALKTALARENKGEALRRIHLVSRSVSNARAIQDFQSFIAASGARSSMTIDLNFISSASAGQDQSDLSLHEAIGVACDKIAFLSETASDYREEEEAYGCKKEPVLHLYFPRDIAALRNAYQAEADTQAQNKGAPQLPRVGLPMNYREPDGFRLGEFPSIATRQTPLSQDAVMRQMLKTLRRQNIKVVVITASSALDELFVLHYFREFSPDIRLVLTEPDLLYIQTAEPRDYTGAIFLSRYPLFVGSTMFQQPDDLTGLTGLTFPSSMSKEQFFACLALLGSGLYDARLKEKPPLFMGVLGKSGYWPVKELDENSSFGLPNGAIAVSMFNPAKPSHYWQFFALLVTIGALAHSFIFLSTQWNLFHLGEKGWTEYYALDHSGYVAGTQIRSLRDRSNYRRARGLVLLLASVDAAIMQLVVVLPTYDLLQQGIANPLSELLVPVGFVGLIGTLIAALWSARAVFGSQGSGPAGPRTEGQDDKGRRSAQWGVIVIQVLAAGLLVALALACLHWRFACMNPQNLQGFFFSYRSVAILGGVSPSLPVLLAGCGIYVCSLAIMRSLAFFHNRFATFPTNFDHVLHSDLGGLQKRLHHAIHPLDSLKGARVAETLLALAGAVLLMLWARPTSIEGEYYDRMVFACVSLIWVFVFMAAVRFVRIWLVSKKLLRRLERLQLRYPLSRLPALFAVSPVWRVGGSERSMLFQTRSFEYLRCLRDVPVPVVRPRGAVLAISQPDEQTELIFSKLKTILQLEVEGRRIPYTEWKDLDDALRRKAEKMIKKDLLPVWEEGGADSVSKEWGCRREDLPHAPKEQDIKVMLAAEFVALRFVAVIRYISLQMRNLLAITSYGFVFAVLALKSYPFQPRQAINAMVIVIFMSIMGAFLWAFSGMQRDAVLKRLSSQEGAKFGLSLSSPLLKFGALPLLTLLASQFPSLFNFLFSWLQPALETLH